MVCNRTSVTRRQQIKANFGAKIEQVRIESALLVVVIDLTVAQKHMSYSQVEHICMAVGLAGRRLRNIALAFTINPHMRHRMIDKKFAQKNLVMQDRLNLEAYGQLIDLQQRRLVRRLAAMKGDTVEMRGERGKLEIKIPNFGSSASCLICALYDCAERVFLEAAALQVKISSHDGDENQTHQRRRRASNNSLPPHNFS